jgi:peptide deformylase
MAIKEIKQHPDEMLSTPARVVDFHALKEGTHSAVKESWLKWIKTIIQNLIDTMDAHNGLGLAAPQIGVPYRIIVFKDGAENKVLINPMVIATNSIVQSYDEGCLSVKGRRLNVRRAKNITVRGYSLNGDQLAEVIVKSKKKMLSFELQHEIDHLNGMTILERGK